MAASVDTLLAHALQRLLDLDAQFDANPTPTQHEVLRREFVVRSKEVSRIAALKTHTTLDLRAFDISDTGLMDYPVLRELAFSPFLRSLTIAPLRWHSRDEVFAWTFLDKLLGRSRQSLEDVVIVMPDESKVKADEALGLESPSQLCYQVIARFKVIDEFASAKLRFWVEWPGGGQALLTSSTVRPACPTSFDPLTPIVPVSSSLPEESRRELKWGSKRDEVRGLRVEIPEARDGWFTRLEPSQINLDKRIGSSYENRKLFETLQEYLKARSVAEKKSQAYYVEQAIQMDDADTLDLVNFDTSDEGFVEFPMLVELERCRRTRLVALPHFDPHPVAFSTLLALLETFKALEDLIVFYDTLIEVEVAREVLAPLLKPRFHPSMPDLELRAVRLSFRKYE